MTHLALINSLLFSPGDQLSREEFLDLWEQMPDLKFAELIDGTVYMPSPLSYEHGAKDVRIHTWVGIYQERRGAERTAQCSGHVLCSLMALLFFASVRPRQKKRVGSGFALF